MSDKLVFEIDERTTVEKGRSIFTIRQLDYFKEKENVVVLTINDLEEILKIG